MCTIEQFLEIFDPDNGPIERGQIWQDQYGNKVRVIYSDHDSVQVIRDTVWQYTSGKNGFFKYGEFSLNFFLTVFQPCPIIKTDG